MTSHPWLELELFFSVFRDHCVFPFPVIFCSQNAALIAFAAERLRRGAGWFFMSNPDFSSVLLQPTTELQEQSFLDGRINGYSRDVWPLKFQCLRGQLPREGHRGRGRHSA